MWRRLRIFALSIVDPLESLGACQPVDLGFSGSLLVLHRCGSLRAPSRDRGVVLGVTAGEGSSYRAGVVISHDPGLWGKYPKALKYLS